MTEIVFGGIKYEPNVILGHGRKSVVFKGYFGEIDVAVKKVLDTDCKALKNAEIDFRTQFKEFGHCNIARIFWIGTFGYYDGGITNYIAMENCSINYEQLYQSKERNIKAYLRRKFKASEVIEQILEGLKYLHRNLLIHGYLDPRNILLCKRMKYVEISDYGFENSNMREVRTFY